MSERAGNNARNDAYNRHGSVERPFVSVVICTLNRPDDLLRTLRYFAEQETYESFEVLVVDQSDIVDPRVRTFMGQNQDRFRMVRRSEKSLPKSRNVGLRSAKGQIITFVDDDVEPFSGFLSGHIAPYVDPGIWGATGPVLDPGNRRLISAHSLTYENLRDLNSGRTVLWNVDFEYDISWLPGCNMSFSRSTIDKIGGFDEFYEVHCDDAEISHRIKVSGGRLRYTPAAQLVHYQRPTGGTRSDPVSSSRYIRTYVRSAVFFERQLGKDALRRTGIFRLFRRLILSRSAFAAGRMGMRQIVAFWLGAADARREFNRRRRLHSEKAQA
jgi:GT2 family glycosyltransferase